MAGENGKASGSVHANGLANNGTHKVAQVGAHHPPTGWEPTPTLGGRGGRLPERVGVRAALLALQREVDNGDELSVEQAEANVRFAVSVRDSEATSVREKLRAVELIEAMRSRGISVAMHTDRQATADEHLAFKATVPEQHAHEVRHMIVVGDEGLL